jgi:SAM-dependent methyltransferase
VKAYKGNALDLSRFDDSSFDLTLIFGPMYHLHDTSDKLTALLEARRVTADGGIIIAAYIMNEFAVITYAFKEKHINEALESCMLDDSFHCTKKSNPLYSFVRIEDIDALNASAGLSRIKLVAADGAANYIRPVLNSLSEEEFRHFTEYHLATCERPDLIGASGHTIDILKK